MLNTIELVKCQLSTLSIEELVIEKNNAVSLIETFVAEGNKELADRYLTELKLNIAATQSLVEEMTQMVNNRFSVEEEKSVVEVIADQLFEQGFYPDVNENSLTVESFHYKLSVEKIEEGFAVQTYCTEGIEHFKTYEWANCKVVKTLKGLNGYLRKFGFGQVAL